MPAPSCLWNLTRAAVTSFRKHPQQPGQIPSMCFSPWGVDPRTRPSPPAPPPVHSASSGATSALCCPQAPPPPLGAAAGGGKPCPRHQCASCSLRDLGGRDATGQLSEKASAWQEVRRTSDSPCFRRQLGTSCSPFPLETKQGKMGLNGSKGDLGQIEAEPLGAAGTGTPGADGISLPGDLWTQASVSGPIHPQGSLEEEEKDQGRPRRSLAPPPRDITSQPCSTPRRELGDKFHGSACVTASFLGGCREAVLAICHSPWTCHAPPSRQKPTLSLLCWG